MHATPLPDPLSERALAGLIVQAVKQVAADLGNTPAVCRKSYINPLVFDAWRSGALHDGIGEELAGGPRKAERLVAAFLRRKAESATKDRTGRAKNPFKASGEAAGRVRPWRDNRSAAG